MNVYELIRQELSVGPDRPTDDEILEKYSDYPKEILTKALKYAHGIISEPSTTEVIFHSGQVMLAPENEEEYENLCDITGGFHRHYWLDDKILEDNKLDIEDAMTILEYYLNSNEQVLAPIFVCGGL